MAVGSGLGTADARRAVGGARLNEARGEGGAHRVAARELVLRVPAQKSKARARGEAGQADSNGDGDVDYAGDHDAGDHDVGDHDASDHGAGDHDVGDVGGGAVGDVGEVMYAWKHCYYVWRFEGQALA
eukprot:5359729-Pleurochrysis_carterae.AAC.1